MHEPPNFKREMLWGVNYSTTKVLLRKRNYQEEIVAAIFPKWITTNVSVNATSTCWHQPYSDITGHDCAMHHLIVLAL